VTDVEVTDAGPGDAGALALVLGDWIRETGWMPVLHSREEDAAFVYGLIRTHVVRVVRDGGQPLGFLARRGGHVDALYLSPAARGAGLGRRLLDEVKGAEAVIDLWAFQANQRALAFYRREGFDEAERTDGRTTDERLPDVRLIWRRLP
jgi:ribosomal protein S18 acetylase RimI-like enzyme